jgi:hypothetical protein
MAHKEKIDAFLNFTIQEAKSKSLPNDILVKDVFFEHEKGYMILILNNGAIVPEDIKKYPALKKASKKELESYKILGGGSAIQWQDLDEDLSVKQIIIDYVRETEKVNKQIIKKRDLVHA